MPPTALSPREKAFVAAYMANKGNGTQAAIAAGYAQNSAGVQASAILARPRVKRAIERRMAKITDRYEVTADKIVRELAMIAFANVGDYIAIQDDGSAIVDLSTATPEQLAALQSIDVEEYVEGRGEDGRLVKKVRIKLADKRAALMDLAKLSTMLPADRLQISGPGGGPVQVESRSTLDLDKLDPEQRAMLKQLLTTAKRGGPVTDVEEITEEEDDDQTGGDT